MLVIRDCFIVHHFLKDSNFEQEVAVMVARSRDGEVTSYPVTETIHRDSICYITQTPAQIPQELQDKARQIAEKAVGCLEGITRYYQHYCLETNPHPTSPKSIKQLAFLD